MLFAAFFWAAYEGWWFTGNCDFLTVWGSSALCCHCALLFGHDIFSWFL